jgi:hypothetical protein
MLQKNMYLASSWVNDIQNMHQKFGVNEWFEKNKHNKDLMKTYLNFRLSMCEEELMETQTALKNGDAEEIVDGLIDLCVFAIGTLEVFNIDADEAWDKVHAANMAKEPGVKKGRPNPFGLPDLLKPEGWTAPTHVGNHGDLSNAV